MKTIINIVIACLMLAGLSACKKEKAYLQETVTLANIPTFINNSILRNNLGTMLNGIPIEQYKEVFLAGPGKFTFYNKNTGAVLLEKEFSLTPTLNDTLYIFQPDSTIAPQLIRNAQKDEPAAPAGYMKLKIANLSNIALTNDDGVPYNKVDIILKSTLVNALRYAPFDTIYSVGSNLDTAQYYLVKKALRNGTSTVQQNYKFSFLDHDTHKEILNSGGTIYETTTFSAPLTGNNVYTLYFTDFEDTQNNVNIIKNNKYYRAQFNLLFE